MWQNYHSPLTGVGSLEDDIYPKNIEEDVEMANLSTKPSSCDNGLVTILAI